MNENLSYSNNGLKLTEGFEGLRLSTYYDQAHVATIGYGHTGHDVTPNLTITQEQAEQLLEHDVQSAENAVKRFVTVPLLQGQFDGLVDFTFNLGAGRLLSSTLLKLVNASRFADAEKEFAKWDRVAGQVSSGLQRRRLSEAELFEHGIIPVTA